MTVIQQIYGTHCTFGTSALERRDGEAASRVLGYSPRASSMPIDELRKTFRAIERYLYYYLPTDAPPSRKLELTAHTAPRRLLFHPSTADLQILALVCYRQWDANRKSAGSYFTHALVSNRATKDAPWSVLDCLRLWGAAGWTMEDDPNITHDLPPLVSLTDLLQSPTSLETDPQPLLSDDLLLEFLTSEQFSYGVGDWLPARWREMPLQQRRDFFTLAFKGYFEIFSQPRDSLLLLVEPEASVLFFYGIARLLPARIRQTLSFSTFETHPDRLTTKLAATSFDNPAAGDVKPERYQRGGFVLNTFVSGKATALRRKDKYVDFILAKLTTNPAHGWQEVDQWLTEFDKAGADSPALLEELIDAEDVTTQLLNPPQPISLTKMQASPKVKQFLQGRVSALLQGPPQIELLDRILASHTHTLEVLKLLCVDDSASIAQPARSYLLERLPADLIATFLNESISATHQLEVLVPYVKQHQQLPPHCDALWSDAAAAGVPSDKLRSLPILTMALARLDTSTIKSMIKKEAAPRPVFFMSLLGVPANPNLDNLLLKFAESLDSNSLVSVIQTLGAKSQQLPEYLLHVFQLKAVAMVNTLGDNPQQFKDKLEALKQFSPVLPKAHLSTYQGWQGILTAFKDAETRSKAEKSLVKRLTEADYDSAPLGRSLFNLIKQVMPDRPPRETGFSDDPRATRLYQIAKALGYERLLPPQFTVAMTSALDRNYWPEAPRAELKEDFAPVIDGLRKYSKFAVPLVVLVFAFAATLILWKSGVFQQFATKPKIPLVAEGGKDGGKKSTAVAEALKNKLTPDKPASIPGPPPAVVKKPAPMPLVETPAVTPAVEVPKPGPAQPESPATPADPVASPPAGPPPAQEVKPPVPPIPLPPKVEPTAVASNGPTVPPVKHIFVVKEADLVKDFPMFGAATNAGDPEANQTKEVVIAKNPDPNSKFILHGLAGAFGKDASRIEVTEPNLELGRPRTLLWLADINAPANKQVIAEFEMPTVGGMTPSLRCWLLPPANPQDRNLQKCLRYCVIELKGSGASHYIALTQLHTPILVIKNNNVTNLSELGVDMLTSNCQLVVQGGVVFNGSKEDLEFGFKDPRKSQSQCEILHNDKSVGAAIVAPNGPHLKFQFGDGFVEEITEETKRLSKELAASIDAHDNDLKVLNKNCIILRSNLNMGPLRPDNETLRARVKAAVDALSDNLGIKFEPMPKKEGDYDGWKEMVIKKLVEPAEEKKKKAGAKLVELKKQQNLELNRPRLERATVKLFRVVKHNDGVSEILVPAVFPPPQSKGDTTFGGKPENDKPAGNPKDSGSLLDKR